MLETAPQQLSTLAASGGRSVESSNLKLPFNLGLARRLGNWSRLRKPPLIATQGCTVTADGLTPLQSSLTLERLPDLGPIFR